MTQRDFCYWLQGFFELSGENTSNGLNKKQTQEIRRHLAMTFNQSDSDGYTYVKPFNPNKAIHIQVPNNPSYSNVWDEIGLKFTPGVSC